MKLVVEICQDFCPNYHEGIIGDAWENWYCNSGGSVTIFPKCRNPGYLIPMPKTCEMRLEHEMVVWGG